MAYKKRIRIVATNIPMPNAFCFLRSIMTRKIVLTPNTNMKGSCIEPAYQLILPMKNVLKNVFVTATWKSFGFVRYSKNADIVSSDAFHPARAWMASQYTFHDTFANTSATTGSKTSTQLTFFLKNCFKFCLSLKSTSRIMSTSAIKESTSPVDFASVSAKQPSEISVIVHQLTSPLSAKYARYMYAPITPISASTLRLK